MPIRVEHIINAITLNSGGQVTSGSFLFSGIVPKRITLYVQVVETQVGTTPESNLTVELSPDGGVTLIDYDKMLAGGGTDAPVSTINYTTTTDDIVSLAPEDVVQHITVTFTAGANNDADDIHVVDVWLVFSY